MNGAELKVKQLTLHVVGRGGNRIGPGCPFPLLILPDVHALDSMLAEGSAHVEPHIGFDHVICMTQNYLASMGRLACSQSSV